MVLQDEQLLMNGTMRSDACGLAIALDASLTHPDTYFSKATNYALMIISLTFLQVLLYECLKPHLMPISPSECRCSS